MRGLKNGISQKWKSNLALLLVLLASTTFPSCMSVPAKTMKIPKRFWLIDPNEAVLFRKINPVTEEALPIKGNAQMKEFVCAHKDELEKELDALEYPYE